MKWSSASSIGYTYCSSRMNTPYPLPPLLPHQPVRHIRCLAPAAAADIQAIRTPRRPRRGGGGFQGGTEAGGGTRSSLPRTAATAMAAAEQTGVLHGRAGRGQGNTDHRYVANQAKVQTPRPVLCRFSCRAWCPPFTQQKSRPKRRTAKQDGAGESHRSYS